MLLVSGSTSTSGDNELIAAPGAGKKIVVYDFVLVHEDATAVTALLRDADATTVAWRTRLSADGEFLSRKLYEEDKRWVLPENKALELNLSATSEVGYTIRYEIRPL